MGIAVLFLGSFSIFFSYILSRVFLLYTILVGVVKKMIFYRPSTSCLITFCHSHWSGEDLIAAPAQPWQTNPISSFWELQALLETL